MKIILDTMGGDNAPDANIKGAINAINKVKAEVILVGKEEVIRKRVKELYGKEQISERHRHRYEYNNEYKERLEKAGLICSGTSPDGKLVEIVEYKEHPYFIAGQFHPELKSRPNRPAPLFIGLVRAAKNVK